MAQELGKERMVNPREGKGGSANSGEGERFVCVAKGLTMDLVVDPTGALTYPNAPPLVFT